MYCIVNVCNVCSVCNLCNVCIFRKTRQRRRRRQRQAQARRQGDPLFAKTKRSLQTIYALKMFDDICIFIKQNKNDKIKIKQMYDILKYEFFVLSKKQEFNNLRILYPFKLVISFFFSIRFHLLSNDDVSGLGLCV